jgi:hypothetical protein
MLGHSDDALSWVGSWVGARRLAGCMSKGGACTSAGLFAEPVSAGRLRRSLGVVREMCHPADAQVGRQEHHRVKDGYSTEDGFARCSRRDPKGDRMIRVALEICSGAASFRAAVCAESIERAVSLVGVRYPGAETTVIFPIEPEAFFVEGPVLVPDTVQPETLEAAG